MTQMAYKGKWECPICGWPKPKHGSVNTMALAAHLRVHHHWAYGCPCGFDIPQEVPANFFTYHAELAAHLDSVGDLAEHIAKANLLEMAREKRGHA